MLLKATTNTIMNINRERCVCARIPKTKAVFFSMLVEKIQIISKVTDLYKNEKKKKKQQRVCSYKQLKSHVIQQREKNGYYFMIIFILRCWISPVWRFFCLHVRLRLQCVRSYLCHLSAILIFFSSVVFGSNVENNKTYTDRERVSENKQLPRDKEWNTDTHSFWLICILRFWSFSSVGWLTWLCDIIIVQFHA